MHASFHSTSACSTLYSHTSSAARCYGWLLLLLLLLRVHWCASDVPCSQRHGLHCCCVLLLLSAAAARAAIFLPDTIWFPCMWCLEVRQCCVALHAKGICERAKKAKHASPFLSFHKTKIFTSELKRRWKYNTQSAFACATCAALDSAVAPHLRV